jgi:hypothetical protein
LRRLKRRAVSQDFRSCATRKTRRGDRRAQREQTGAHLDGLRERNDVQRRRQNNQADGISRAWTVR